MIEIMGVVGAGKSTLSKLLSSRENLPLFPEPVESNPYLTEYYKEPEKYAFNMQLFLLHSRFRQALEAEKLPQCVMDASIRVNDIFSYLQFKTGIMNSIDYQVYSDISNTYKSMLMPPDLVVYLQCSPQVSVNRIMKRNRTSELVAPLQYWYQLNQVYEEWYEGYKDSKKICINVDTIDFVRQEDEEDYILDCILEALN